MVNNRSNPSSGGAIAHDDALPNRVRLRNSIVISDIDYHHSCAGGTLQENRGNLISDNSCGAPALTGDPLLAGVTGLPAYYPLQVDSPARDVAVAAFCPATDQIGTPRPQGAGCDIGAIEFGVASPLQPESEASAQAPMDCAVTTTHNLNFRDSPDGVRIGLVPGGLRLRRWRASPAGSRWSFRASRAGSALIMWSRKASAVQAAHDNEISVME